MKKNIFKKIFIKISKILGYEIIDQNEFYSPTLEKSVDENLSNLNKSIVLPLGEVKLTRKINSILILFRTNTNVEIWDQNKKRIFEFPKIEYVLRSLNSLIKSINYLKKKNNNIEIKLKIIDDNSKNENLIKIKEIRLRPRIEDHDLMTKLNMGKKFLSDGCKLKITLIFRGRELSRIDLGKIVMDRVLAELDVIAEVEKDIPLEGRRMSVILISKK